MSSISCEQQGVGERRFSSVTSHGSGYCGVIENTEVWEGESYS